VKTTATNKRIRELLTAIGDGTLIPRPEFQRRLVWALRHKNAFIQTVLEGFPFPEIYIAAGDVDLSTGVGTLMLVDLAVLKTGRGSRPGFSSSRKMSVTVGTPNTASVNASGSSWRSTGVSPISAPSWLLVAARMRRTTE
jgi:hypothetical protein